MATGAGVEYNFLGNSGLKVSNIALGTMTFGTMEEGFMSWFFNAPKQLDEQSSHKILDRYVELGGNFIDTADMYSRGKCEQFIGNWLSSRNNRDGIVLASKAGMPMNLKDPNDTGLSRRHLVKSCEDSLKRLQTDHLDLYQAHIWDDATPLEETLRTFDDLVRCGKIRYYGFSNVCGWQLQKVVETAKRLNLSPCVSLQQQYSLLRRHSELEEFKVCENEGLGVLTWSPLKGGLLTGKFKKGQKIDSSGSRAGYTYAQESHGNLDLTCNWSDFFDNENYWNLIDVMEKIAKNHEKSLAQVAIRWLLQRKFVSSVTIGATSLAQLNDNMGAAAGWKLTDEEMAELDKASSYSLCYPYDMLSGFVGTRTNPFKK